MKIIQSCWSCNATNLYEYSAGWASPEYNLMSWALSCLQLNKYYEDVVLYTDSASARVLVDELRLPYSSVRCELDELNKFNSELWALPKIYAYSKQKEPFLHVDSDVFIWAPFNHSLLSSELIAQNMEIVNEYYSGIMQTLEAHLKYFPKEIIDERKRNGIFCAYNAGIMGGSDIAFFQQYTAEAFKFVSKNIEYLKNINVGHFNVFYEQYLFYCLIKKQNRNVGVLIPDILYDYPDFGDFTAVPHKKQFLHLLGQYKVHRPTYEQMANRLRLDHPDYYYRIISLFKNRRLPLKKNFYGHLHNVTDQDLITRYFTLKESYAKQKIDVLSPNSIFRNFESNSSRVNLVKNTVIDIINNGSEKTNDTYASHLNDVQTFEDNIDQLLKDVFSKYCTEYLYGRDANHIEYFEFVYGNDLKKDKIKIVTDPLFKVIKSHYDWTDIEFGEYGQEMLLEQLESVPATNYTAIIPESDSIGYSLLHIDELDLNILEICKTALSPAEIFTKVASSFDQKELDESRAEFEELITGRIQMAYFKKLIKVVKN